MDKFTWIGHHKFKEFLFLSLIKLWKHKVVCVLTFWCWIVFNAYSWWLMLLLLHRLLLLLLHRHHVHHLPLIWVSIHVTLTLVSVLTVHASLASITSWGILWIVVLHSLLLLLLAQVKILHWNSRIGKLVLLLLLIGHILPKMINLCFHLHFYFFQ